MSFETKKICAVSVDLDEIPNYFEIHGIGQTDAPASAMSLVYDLALERLDSLAKGEEIPLTLFAIGRDLDRPEAAAALKRMRAAGHEIANHSLDHLYDLTRKDRATVRDQIAQSADAIERAVGER